MKKVPSDILIIKAVDFWCKKLMVPFFDNGDDSENGFFGQALANMNSQHDKNKISNMEERIELFRSHLVSELIKKRDVDEYFYGRLDVDYHPCKELAEAAEVAGIPPSQFSVKSSVSIYDNRVIVGFGYGAQNVNYYPLIDGRWLETTLCGSDEEMEKVFDYVVNGGLLKLSVVE